ncbi:MAG: hypothetical protein IPM47_12515 [Sphingobacteriales bacterium]|nr:MAG: hypothetical protein IPM47_12515 [Sphingobacteriales bacterium]
MTLRFSALSLFCLALLIVLIYPSCNKEENDPTTPNTALNKIPLAKLSDYRFFTGNIAELNPNEGVLPYDLNSPLFSDYAEKARFVWLPEGTSATYHESEAFDFPVGAIIIKTFYYDNDKTDPSKGRRIIETRLLVRHADKWQPYDYIWNEEQTEAGYSVVGMSVPVEWVNENGQTQQAEFLIPNKNECKGCHSYDGKFVPIGPKARHLNKDFNYPDGTMNQLEKWTAKGYLNSAPSNLTAIPKAPVWNDPLSGSLDLRARAYLDINCGHCHNYDGPANTSGLSLTWSETNDFALGICKPPIAAGQGSGGFLYGIVPGKPEESILIYRMNSTLLDVAMPELGRSVIHSEGLQLISDWIASMPPVSCQ